MAKSEELREEIEALRTAERAKKMQARKALGDKSQAILDGQLRRERNLLLGRAADDDGAPAPAPAAPPPADPKGK